MKDFLLIGPLMAMNGLLYPLLVDGSVWIPPERSCSPKTGKEYATGQGWNWFGVDEDYWNEVQGVKNPVGLCKTDNEYLCAVDSCWYFHIPRKKPYHFTPTREYTPEAYPKLDNYDAIAVKRWPYIPKDYQGDMAVPITYLFIHNPQEYEIVERITDAKLKGKRLFTRLIIRRKQL